MAYYSQLIKAIQNNDIDDVRRYIKIGAEVNHREKDKLYPIEMAVACGADDNLGIIKYLIKVGAADIKKHSGDALSIASKNGHLKIMDILIKAGANVNSVNQDGDSVLISIFADDNSDRKIHVISKLIKAGANVNAKDKYGDAVLMYAAAYDDHINIIILLRSGAHINAKNNMGETALMHSTRMETLDNLKELIKAGANLNIQDNNGRTALMWAARSSESSLEMTKELIKAGANLFIKDNKNRTAIDGAKPSSKTFLENHRDNLILLAMSNVGIKRLGQRSGLVKLDPYLLREIKKHIY